MTKRQELLLKLLMLTLAILQLVKVYVSNEMVTDGIQLGELQEQTKEIQKQNKILREEILERSSLRHLAEEAEKQGFVPAQYIYLYDR